MLVSDDDRHGADLPRLCLVIAPGIAISYDTPSKVRSGIRSEHAFTVQFLQLPAVVLVERLRARRAIATWAAGIGQFFLLATATAPFLGATAGIITLVVCVAFYQAMAAIAGVRLCWPVHRECCHRLFGRLAAVDHARPADAAGCPAHAHRHAADNSVP